VLAALYIPRFATPAAGLAAALTGLGVAALYTALVSGLGTHSAEWDTMIWRTSVFGVDVALWQEYAVLFALPASLLAFALGSLFGRPPITKVVA
jgi:hypothetical protein